MRLYNVLILKIVIVTLLCLSTVLMAFLGSRVFFSENTEIPLFIKVSKVCDTKSIHNKHQLIAYVPSEALAYQVSDKLCLDPVISRQFGQVKVYWGNKLGDSIEFLGKGIADLILAKEHFIQAFRAESTYNYQAVLAYPSYTAFFISLNEKPKLTKNYFIDKKIGLLDYPTSQSGHILPKGLFKKLNLNMDVLNITYVNSHDALRELLARGEVDIIASYWKSDDTKRFSKNYITPISSKISGSKWYLKMDVENTDLFCSVQKSLASLAKEQNSVYFSHAETIADCDEVMSEK